MNKTKQNPTPINKGAVADFNQKTNNKSRYNDNDDDDNDDIVIVEDVNKDKEENDESDNPNYSKQGIFGQYTNYGYTNHKTTTDEVSINTKDTVNTNKETETDNSINQGKRDVPTNTNNDREVKLPNTIEALSGRKFKADELTTYGDEFGPPKVKRMLRISDFNTYGIQLNEIKSTCQESIDLQVVLPVVISLLAAVNPCNLM